MGADRGAEEQDKVVAAVASVGASDLVQMSDEIDQFDEGGAPSPHLIAHPGRVWKGKPIHPYSFGRRLLTRVILKTDPADEMWVLGVIYVLLLTDQETADALYNPKAFKEALFKFVESFEDEDYKAAADLAAEIVSEAKGAEVKAAEDKGELPKKKA